jgi:hypothetical protein
MFAVEGIPKDAAKHHSTAHLANGSHISGHFHAVVGGYNGQRNGQVRSWFTDLRGITQLIVTV